MSRLIFLIVGGLEGVVAVVLVWLGWQLPGQDEVAQGFQSAERVTRRASDQVHIFQRQVQELRHPELMQLAERLQSQTRTVAGNVKNQAIDFDTVQSMRDSL